MRFRLPLLAVLLAAAGLAAAVALAADGDLSGRVGPGFNIRLSKADGSAATQLDAGAYRIVIEDVADEHNFHLSGPGVDESTSVEGTGTVTWNVTLRDGTYTFVCDPHSSTMRGTIRVGAGGPTTTTAPPPTPTPARRYVASVGPGNTISLRTAAGARVTTLKPGAVTIAVADRSAKLNFHLTGVGVNRKTGIAQRGTVTWKLTLRAGALAFRSDAGPKTLRGSAVVR